MENLCELAQLIDKHLYTQVGFAVFRLPYTSQIALVVQTSGSPQTISLLSELDKTSGFVLTPFDAESTLPMVVIRPEVTAFSTQETLHTLRVLPLGKTHSTAKIQPKNISHVEYNIAFENCLSRINRGEICKIVLARSCEERPLSSAGDVFVRACSHNPHSFVYLCHSPLCGTWLGATPETLIARHGEQYFTMALAGTRPANTPEPWSLKNHEEQQYVGDYIKEKLLAVSTNICASETTTRKAGNVEHLCTTFEFDSLSGIGSLAALLHPTPAICGQPQAAALHVLRQVEPTRRLYYSGVVGIAGLPVADALFVNLRCLLATSQSTTLFAGGGLLRQSTADTEWDETELKMKTLSNILHQ